MIVGIYSLRGIALGDEHGELAFSKDGGILSRGLVEDDISSCPDLLEAAYATEYQVSMSPCNCTQEDDIYHIICNYDYCPDCIDSQCAFQSTHDYYTAAGELLRGIYCIEFITGIAQDTISCFDFGRPDAVGRAVEDDTGLFCEVRVGTTACTSCEYISCVTEDGNFTSAQPLIDCSNIVYTDGSGFQNSGRVFNLCSSTNDDFPKDSPFVIFRRSALNFESCYEAPYYNESGSTTKTPARSTPSSSSPTILPMDFSTSFPITKIGNSSTASNEGPATLLPSSSPTSVNNYTIVGAVAPNTTLLWKVNDGGIDSSTKKFHQIWLSSFALLGLAVSIFQ